MNQAQSTLKQQTRRLTSLDGKDVLVGDRLWNLMSESYAVATVNGMVFESGALLRWGQFIKCRWAWTAPSVKVGTTDREYIVAAILAEREFQDLKWGTIQQHPHEVGSWLTIMRKLLTDAEAAYAGQRGNRGAMDELRKVVAVGFACMEQHGAVARDEMVQ